MRVQGVTKSDRFASWPTRSGTGATEMARSVVVTNPLGDKHMQGGDHFRSARWHPSVRAKPAPFSNGTADSLMYADWAEAGGCLEKGIVIS